MNPQVYLGSRRLLGKLITDPEKVQQSMNEESLFSWLLLALVASHRGKVRGNHHFRGVWSASD